MTDSHFVSQVKVPSGQAAPSSQPLRVDTIGTIRRLFQSGFLFSALLYVSAGLFAVVVLMVPLYLLVRAGTAWAEVIETLMRPTTIKVMGNTVLLAAGVTTGATCLAVPLAWLTVRTDLPGRRLWSVLHALPLVIPSYIFAFLFLSFMSPKGLLQQWVGQPLHIDRLPAIYGFFGALLVLTLISYPYIFLTVQAALRQMDPTLLEVAQTNGASKRQIIRYVLLPYLWPSMTAGGLLVALYSLRDFGAVSMMQFSTFTRVIYNRYQGFQLDEAATLATVLVALTGLILLFESRFRSDPADAPEEVSDAGATHRIPLGKWRWPALGFTALISFFALFMPVAVLGYWLVRGLRQDWLTAAVGNAQRNSAVLADLIGPARSSLTIALLAAVLAVALAVPLTILTVRHNGRWARLLERISYTGFALPGIVVALAIVFVGINYFPSLYQTLPLLLVAYMVLFVPQAVSAGRSVLAGIPAELEEVGYTLGGSRWAIMRHVTLPLMRPGLVAGGLLVFLTVMKELPATLLLSPLGYRTLPMLVWSNISEAFFARAALPTLLLLLFSSVPLGWFSLRRS